MFTCIYCPRSTDLSLAEFGYSFSPLVEETAPDCVVLDVAGCELRFGSAYQLANEIADYAARPRATGGLNQSINVALAGNPDTAILAARFLKGITFIAPGEELTALGDLSIECLLSPTPKVQGRKSDPDSNLKTPNSGLNKQTLDFGPWTLDIKEAEEILETFRLWGVRTFRDFAKLPTVGVAERLGQRGVRLQQLAGGKTERHLQLKQPAPTFHNGIELEYPLTELEPLSFIFARLLNQLCASLLSYALATNELRVQLKLEDGTSHDRTLSLPTPLRDHKIFLKLLLLDTELHPPQQGVVGVTVACDPVKPRVLQSGLFIPQAPEPAKLELTLARLAKLVGCKNIGSPEVLDTHRPDAFQIKRFLVVPEKKRGRGDAEKRGRGDAEKRGRRDAETRGRGDAETQGRGDAERRGRRDAEIQGRGDAEKRRRGDAVMRDIPHADTSQPDVSHPYNMSLITPSPRPRISASPRPRISASPRHRVSASPSPPVHPRLGFRVFRPPLRALVDARRGYPQQVSAWGPNRSVYGKVVQLAGPWRRTGDWWRDDCWARDEWDVAVEQSGSTTSEQKVSQALYRIYRELRSGAWFVEGSYD